MEFAIHHLVAWFTVDHWSLLINLRYHFIGIVDPTGLLHKIAEAPRVHIGTAVVVHS